MADIPIRFAGVIFGALALSTSLSCSLAAEQSSFPGSSVPLPREVDPLLVQGKLPVTKEVDPFVVFGTKQDSLLAKVQLTGLEATPLVATAARNTCSVDLPFDIHRSIAFFQRSRDAEECSTAVRNIQSLQKSFGPVAYNTLRDPTYLADVGHSLARATVSAYVNSCTRQFQDQIITKLLGVDNLLRVQKNIGILTTPTVMCVGSVVDGRVLTARHCLVSGPIDDGAAPILPEGTPVDFTTLGGIKLSLGFQGTDRSPLTQASRDKDWISLSINGNFNESEEERLTLKPDLALLWQPLVLVSFSPYTMALRDKFEPSIENAVIDISPLCTIFARDGGYVFHDCQTLAGMSGSPLMTMDGGRLTVVGVHTGDSEALDTACARSVSTHFINYGVVP